ncbi:MAG: translocation/assembly module TamB domain-containing protein [Micavibrio sp.]|nr:translocation/assembly module TamB domain-containing protein [Micavibrio sp.]
MAGSKAQNPPAKKSRLQRTRRALGYAASIFFALMIVLQLLFWGGARWLNGSGGQAWLLTQIDSALAGSGYSARVTGLHLSVLGTLTADDWQVSDTNGVFAEGAGLRLHVSPARALYKTLGMTVDADSITLIRPPQTAAPATPAAAGPLQPFTMPDVYFHRLSLRRLHIDKLTLPGGVSLAPDIKASADIDGNDVQVMLTGSIAPAAKDDPLANYLPEDILLKGSFTATSLKAAIETLKVTAKAYDVDGAGTADLAEGGDIAVALKATNSDLAAVTAATLAGKADMTLSLRGKTLNPDLTVSAQLQQGVYRGKNIGDATLEAAVKNIVAAPDGTVNVAGSYNGKPVKLDAVLSSKDGIVTLDSLTGNAPEFTLSGKGSFNTASSLADATLQAKLNLEPYREFLPANLRGKVGVTLAVQPQNNKQAAQLQLQLDDMGYTNLSLKSASLKLALADVAALWPQEAALKIAGFTTTGVSVPDAALQLTQAGDKAYDLKLDGKAALADPFKFSGKARLEGANWQDITARDLTLTVSPKSGGATVQGNANRTAAQLELVAKNLPFGIIPASLPDALRGMTVSGKAGLTGTLAAPELSGDLALSPLKAVKGAPAVTLKLAGGYKAGQGSVAVKGSGKGITVLDGNTSLPLTLSLYPFALELPPATPLQGKLVLKAQAGALTAALLPPDTKLTGSMAVKVDIAGTLAAPAAVGDFSLASGAFSQTATGLALQNINLSGILKKDGVDLTRFSATDGGKGSIKAAGSYVLSGGAAKAQLDMQGMEMFKHSDIVAGSLSAALTLAGDAKAYTLKGKIKPDEISINIPERLTSDIPKLNVIDPRRGKVAQQPDALKALALNISVEAPNQVFVRGWGLDAEFGGTLDVGGTAATPLVNGSLDSKRGRYEEFGKRFTIDHATLRFQGEVPPSPYLDVLAETVSGDITSQVALTGPVSKPAIAFSAVPAVPQDEVLSHILFGKSMDKISPFQAMQLARTVQRFSGKGGNTPDPLGVLRGATGLDDISVDSADDGSTTVGAGKYVTDKVYLEVESGSAKNSGGAKVQVELTPKVKLESKVGQDSQAGAAITWGWDY